MGFAPGSAGPGESPQGLGFNLAGNGPKEPKHPLNSTQIIANQRFKILFLGMKKIVKNRKKALMRSSSLVIFALPAGSPAHVP